MKILTDKSLHEAIELCQEHDRYRVLIVTQYAKDHNSILDDLSKAGMSVVRSWGHPRASFPNGSIIEMVPIAANTRGRKVHLVLCQAEVYNIDSDTRHVLESIEVVYRDFKLL